MRVEAVQQMRARGELCCCGGSLVTGVESRMKLAMRHCPPPSPFSPSAFALCLLCTSIAHHPPQSHPLHRRQLPVRGRPPACSSHPIATAKPAKRPSGRCLGSCGSFSRQDPDVKPPLFVVYALLHSVSVQGRCISRQDLAVPIDMAVLDQSEKVALPSPRAAGG